MPRVGHGEGGYLDPHTGPTGFRQRVDDDTMATILRRYGVDDEEIRHLPLTLTKKETFCNICNKPAGTKYCSQCQKVPYCSKKCQVDAWKVHKIFCGMATMQVDPPAAAGARLVKALFLPENEESPKLVKLLKLPDHDVDSSRFIEGPGGIFRSDFFPRADPKLISAYHILYNDSARVDGISQENACLGTICRAVAKAIYKDQQVKAGRNPALHLKGNLLVVRCELNQGSFLTPQSQGIPLNVSSTDMHEIAKLLYWVNAAYTYAKLGEQKVACCSKLAISGISI
jgi:MYND finger